MSTAQEAVAAEPSKQGGDFHQRKRRFEFPSSTAAGRDSQPEDHPNRSQRLSNCSAASSSRFVPPAWRRLQQRAEPVRDRNAAAAAACWYCRTATLLVTNASMGWTRRPLTTLMNHERRLLFLGETSYFLIRDCRVIISIGISFYPPLYSVYSIKRRLAILWRILLTGGPGVWRSEHATYDSLGQSWQL